MKREHVHSDGQTVQRLETSERGVPSACKRRRRRLRAAVLLLILFAIVGGAAWAVLPGVLRSYVNRTLDRNPLYEGSIGEVQIQFWRGAYSIKDVRISKTTGPIPVPFFSAQRVDFALEWNALLHRKVVGRILMEGPEMNFVDAGNEGEEQTGAGGAWLQMIRDLFPFTINSAIIKNGSIHFRFYQAVKPVDVYLSQVEGAVENLSNIRDETKPLVSTVQARALAMDQAKLEFNMTLDPFSYRPTFHLAIRLLGLDVTKINDLALAYGNFDFKRGWFDLVIETNAREGQLTGYAKPLFRDLKVFSVGEDIKDGNVLHFFWQALIGGVAKVLKNQPRDRFGTLIPFSGDLSETTTADILATIGNVLRNAFIRAYLPRLESGQEAIDGLQFAPADLTDPISVGETSSL